ncbi:2-polyprenyl-6-methoxyphenol hydroxylase-like FAD-dependent oxidoreductase [Pseudarthrobacter sp. W1I19]|uniref:FAD-dependent monooxygenase n=1 Tax=Pseudarthrobacter sp. W1I19 TaxID=3042288 RepID=UPI002788A90F|nr:FAD-dependent monooxygenase [Pseudarthrobacter sp. W1I19]MDQ0925496.1 2-polyprenyl-6-methoxyphenol hydroxylase-like FAD-dependent oxidoreductase [Pseudarthrobacter sp. W1I19]
MVTHRFASPEHIPAEVQILISGGGPSGLFLALDLASRGIPSLVIEPRDAVDHARPRAKTTNARTMTHLRRLGLADALRAASPLPVGYSQDVSFCTGLTGPGAHELRRFRDAFQLVPGRYGPQPECGQQVPQPVLEEVLRAAVADSPLVTMMTGWSVETVEASDAGYAAVVSDASGARRTVTAEYVIGADGATSAVRRSLGIRLEGGSAALSNISILFRSEGLASAVNLDPAVQYWVVGADTSGMVGPMDLDGTWWAIIQGVNPEEAVDTAKAGGMVRSLVGADVDIEVLATDPWTARMLLAPEYRRGGVFLMGDAAHLNPPWGGHGFNTCVGDAANLAWKLAAVVTGWADANLLDSYEAERRPVAARTINDAASNGKALAYHFADPALLADGPAGATAREAAHEALAVKQSEFDSLGLVLGYAYGDSPGVVPDGSPAPVEDPIVYVPSASPGALLPHAWLDESASVYNLLGRDFTLLVDAEALAGRPAQDVFAAVVDAGKRKGIPVAIAAVGPFDDGTPPSELWGAHAVLVRPDQHVAWRGSSAEAAAAALSVAAGRHPAEDLDQNQHTEQEGEARVRVIVP